MRQVTALSPDLLGAIKTAFKRLDPELLKYGAYYEFGVYQGASLCFAELCSRDLRGHEFMFYGFDSFMGLPKNDHPEINWHEGAYRADLWEVEKNIGISGADREKIVLTPGFFSQSVFKDFWEKHTRPPAILVIDSDLYESCKQVLEFFGPKLVPGSIVIMDDWDVSADYEQRAWREFHKKYPSFWAEPLFGYPTDGRVFEVIAASGAH